MEARGEGTNREFYAITGVRGSLCVGLYCLRSHPRLSKDEEHALTDQLRRSSRSIGSNIAESWAKRRYKAHFVSKLTDMDGELQETKHWIHRAEAYGYLPAETVVELISRRHSLGRMLGKMIENPTTFCRQPPPVSPPPRNL
jgi:four helix bundle protein